MTELIIFLLLIVAIWLGSYVNEKQHDDIKKDIKELNDKIDKLKKD